MLKLHTIARDKKLYSATATYDNGQVTVHKGSLINRNNSYDFHARPVVRKLLQDESLFDGNILVVDLVFTSLSTAASFVTGRTANGNIVWKTENNKYVKYTLEDK